MKIDSHTFKHDGTVVQVYSLTPAAMAVSTFSNPDDVKGTQALVDPVDAAGLMLAIAVAAGIVHHDPDDTPYDEFERTEDMGDLNIAAFHLARHVNQTEKAAHIAAEAAAQGKAREAEDRLRNFLAPEESAKFIDACADLAQMGFTAELVESVAHAMQNHRILAFGWGEAHDVGERGIPGLAGATKGTRPFGGPEA